MAEPASAVGRVPSATSVEAYSVRRARADEYAAIDALIDEAYAHDYGASDHDDPMYASAYRAREYDVWVAVEADGALLGSATTRRRGGPPLHEDFVEDEFDLRLLGVSPAARRRGVAAAIMRTVTDEARAEGFRAVCLKTMPTMTGAHRLYEALGFERRPERDGLWIDGEKVLDLFAYVFPLAD